jgi:hypothetical protein
MTPSVRETEGGSSARKSVGRIRGQSRRSSAALLLVVFSRKSLPCCTLRLARSQSNPEGFYENADVFGENKAQNEGR